MMGPYYTLVGHVLLIALTCQMTSSKVHPQHQRFEDCHGKAADVVFVLDASNSIWDVDFKRQLSFVNEVVDLFHIGSRNQKVSVVTYSDHPQLQFPFYAYNLKSDVKAAVSHVRQSGGHDTKTDEALAYIREYSFSTDQGARMTYWVNRIGIIITDGDSRNATATKIEAQKARDSGIHLFAIGVGSEVRNEELEMIASKPTEYYTFRVNDFKSMDTIKNFLAIKTCAATNPPTTKRTTTTTTTTTTTKPTTSTTTTTTTTTTKKPTQKPTTSTAFSFDVPIEAPELKGTSSRMEKFNSKEFDTDSRDLSHTLKLNNRIEEEPRTNFKPIFEEHPKNLNSLAKPEGFDEIGADEPSNILTNEKGKVDREGEGSGNAIESVFDKKHGSIHGHRSYVTPMAGTHLMEPSNVIHDSWTKPVNPDDWNIISNQQDLNQLEEHYSGSSVDEHGNNLLNHQQIEDDPYNIQSLHRLHLNPSKLPRSSNCDNEDFWGTDDNDRSVYYKVAEHVHYHHSHRKRFFYHIIFVDPVTNTEYFRNSKKDFWGYDDHGSPLGMRFYEPYSDLSREAEKLSSWSGPVYEMLSGPCFPTLPTRPHNHYSQFQEGKSTNSLYVRVIEKNYEDSQSGNDDSNFVKDDNLKNDKFVDNYIVEGDRSNHVKLLDRHGSSGFWDYNNVPRESPVWYQFVCPGVYVKANNNSGQPLDPHNIPSRINLPPPPSGDPARGCWTKRRRTSGVNSHIQDILDNHLHSATFGSDDGQTSNNVYNYDKNEVKSSASKSNIKVSDNSIAYNKGANHDQITDDEYELVWVEYTGPGSFDPVGERPGVTFETENKKGREGFIPGQDNRVMEMMGYSSSRKFSGKPKLWGVQRNGTIHCLMPESKPLAKPHQPHYGHTNGGSQLSLPSFLPDTVRIQDGYIYAELLNGTYAPIGCMIGTTHMIGWWINKNAALAILGNEGPLDGKDDFRYFFGYPVDSHKFKNVPGEIDGGKHSLNGQPKGPAKEEDWKPSSPLKLQACRPNWPLDLVVGVDVRSRSGKRRRRSWQIVKDFVSGLDMKKGKVSVRFAHDYIDLIGPRTSAYGQYVPVYKAASLSSNSQRRRLKRSDVFTEKKELLGKINEMESMHGTSSLIQAMSDMLTMDGFALSKEELDICNKSSVSEPNAHSHRASDRTGTRKIAILIVDGVIEDIEDSVRLASDMIQNMNFELFVVGIGKTIDPIQLMSLASNNGASVNYFSFDSNRHDPRYLKQLESFFLHKDPHGSLEKLGKTKNAHSNTRLQYKHEVLKMLTRFCENR